MQAAILGPAQRPGVEFVAPNQPTTERTHYRKNGVPNGNVRSPHRREHQRGAHAAGRSERRRASSIDPATEPPVPVDSTGDTPPPASPGDASGEEVEPTVTYQSVADWHGKELIDCDGATIGKLERVYFDVETDEPQFGTVKEGFMGRHLTFVPLIGATIGPDALRVSVSRNQVKEPHDPAGRRHALTGRRIGPLPPLRAQLHPHRHHNRATARPPLAVG